MMLDLFFYVLITLSIYLIVSDVIDCFVSKKYKPSTEVMRIIKNTIKNKSNINKIKDISSNDFVKTSTIIKSSLIDNDDEKLCVKMNLQKRINCYSLI